MKKKNEKTNVMRILEQKNIKHSFHYYYDTDAVSGTEVADILGEDPKRVFKTLVTVGAKGTHYVYLVPVCDNLNLKKAARAVGEKSIEMIPVKELLPLTGYIHGGCSPIGMKKTFETVINSSAANYETVFFSGGRIGCQVEMSLGELERILRFKLCDISDSQAE